MERLLLTLILLLATAALILSHGRRTKLRILYGLPDTENKYSFIVALVSAVKRRCTGTLMSPDWVLTAAHCVDCELCDVTHVQYGNMSMLPNITQSKNSILELFRHPGYRPSSGKDDIALLRISPISLSLFGQISAVDYHSLGGYAVEYAGFGTTEYNNVEDDRRLLLVGEGVVRSCLDVQEQFYSLGLYLCVAPKCSNIKGDSAPGDSGGPLFYDKKIVGVVSSGITPIGVYTAISPYITWVHGIIKDDESRRYISKT